MTTEQVPNSQAISLSAESAFVVHFAVSATGAAEEVQGRVEHISSGRWTRFASSAELFGFMQQILRQDA